MAQLSADERALHAELGELRAEVAERGRVIVVLTEENTGLREQNATLAEKLVALVEPVAELERRLGQNPRNSPKPASSEGYDKPAPRSRRERTDRASGGQPGHEGRTLRQVEAPDERVVHTPRGCGGCGRSLVGAPVVSTETQQVFDLPEIVLRVVEHRFEHRSCDCGATTMADVPTGVGGPTQYGPRMRALAVYLLAAQHLPVVRTAELLSDVVHAPVSPGSLAGWYAATAAGLGGVDAALRDALGAAPVLGADETGIRVGGALAWVHAARTDTLTRYTVSPRRGVEAMLAAGVLPALTPDTVLVSHFWSPYWSFDIIHAVCAAHLGRELVAAADIEGQTGWANGLDRLLIQIKRTVAAARDAGADGLAATLLTTYRRRYDEFITAGWAANPDHHPGRRGKGKPPKHVNLLDRLDTHRDEVLRSCHDLRVPFTNNGSEQDIRPLKIGMKVAGCLRSTTGAEAFCRLRSYLSTARKQGQSPLIVLRTLRDGSPWMPATAG